LQHNEGSVVETIKISITVEHYKHIDRKDRRDLTDSPKERRRNPESSRSKAGALHRHGHCPAHNLQQNSHASVPVEALKHSHLLRKWASHHAHALTRPEAAVETHEARFVEAGNQRLHNSRRDRNRSTVGAQETSHPKGPVDMTPAASLEVEPYEDVAWENRRNCFAELAGMPNGLMKARQKDPKILRRQVKGSQIFTAMQGLSHDPALALSQIEIVLRGLHTKLPQIFPPKVLRACVYCHLPKAPHKRKFLERFKFGSLVAVLVSFGMV
jgi:hypothetical protein